MNFYRESVKSEGTGRYITTKIYKCPVCGYVYKTTETHGEITVLNGDKKIIIFPFSSFTREDGLHAELCACPHCQTIQYINKVEEI